LKGIAAEFTFIVWDTVKVNESYISAVISQDSLHPLGPSEMLGLIISIPWDLATCLTSLWYYHHPHPSGGVSLSVYCSHVAGM